MADFLLRFLSKCQTFMCALAPRKRASGIACGDVNMAHRCSWTSNFTVTLPRTIFEDVFAQKTPTLVLCLLSVHHFFAGLWWGTWHCDPMLREEMLEVLRNDPARTP